MECNIRPGRATRIAAEAVEAVEECVKTCPAVFELVDGKSHVKVDTVPAVEEENVRDAVAGCPVLAISEV